MKQTKTILELADDYAKAYFMGRGDDARKLLQAAIMNNDTNAETYLKIVMSDYIALVIECASLNNQIKQLEARRDCAFEVHPNLDIDIEYLQKLSTSGTSGGEPSKDVVEQSRVIWVSQ